MSNKSFWTQKLEQIQERKRSSSRNLNDQTYAALKEKVQTWEKQLLEPYISQLPERKDLFENASGIPVKRVYTPLDSPDSSYAKELGMPGDYPYTRGVYPSMYRGRLWTMRMFSGFGTADQTNKRLKYLLKEGETGLSIAFDMPTLYGYDADSVRAEGEVGRCGFSLLPRGYGNNI
jgi:methylmalonyl-CoA mutase N-terminal domain/subunit